ncbi:MAG: hypothetical protein ABIQ32_01270 [Sphingomicrobium sp.]
MAGGLIKGCGIAALVAVLMSVALYVRFLDASSNQSAEDCFAKMSGPILEKTTALPANGVLRDKKAQIEHQLYGNESRVRALAKSFNENGWQTSVEPMDEIGWATIIVEDPANFRLQAAKRVKQLCSIAEKNAVQYRHWSVNAPGLSGYVAQYGDSQVEQR